MMTRLQMWTLCLLSIFVAGPVQAGSVQVLGVNSANFPTIEVEVSVQDDTGVALCDLPVSDFSILENGLAAGVFDVHWEGGDCGRNVVLVVDHSVLMRSQGRMQCAKDEANAILDLLVPGDAVTVITYDGCSELLVPRTTDIAAARNAIDELTPVGRAAMTDGIYHGIREACDQGGGSVIWIGHGGDSGSGDCSLPPDGSDTEGLDDDLALIRSLGDGCPVSFHAVAASSTNRRFLELVAESFGGSAVDCGSVTALDPDAWLGATQSRCCTATLTYQSPVSELDGTSRNVEVCSTTADACGGRSYDAHCSSFLELTATSRALIDAAACLPIGSNPLMELEGRICSSFVGHLVLASSTGTVQSIPLGETADGYAARIPEEITTADASLDLHFEGSLDGIPWREPPIGSYVLGVCSEAPSESLAVTLGQVTVAAGEQGSLELSLTGDSLPYVTSYEVDIRVHGPSISIAAVSQNGSVTEAASWLSPAWNEVEPGLYRISAAGANRITSFGALATLTVEVDAGAPTGCTALEIVRVQLNDGEPMPVTEDGEVCATGGCRAGFVRYWSGAQPGLAGVFVVRESDGVATSRTDAAGMYSICDDGMVGDVLRFESTSDTRPRVTPLDASDVLRATVGIDDLEQQTVSTSCGAIHPRRVAADVSGDGIVGAYDASLILQYVVQSLTEFPSPMWSFVCSTITVDESRNLGTVFGIATGDVNGNSGASDPLNRSPQSSSGPELRLEPGEDGTTRVVAGSDDSRGGVLRVLGDLRGASIEPAPDVWAAANFSAAHGIIAFAMAGVDAGETILTVSGEFALESATVNDRTAAIIDTRSSEAQRINSLVALRLSTSVRGISMQWRLPPGKIGNIAIFDARGRVVDRKDLVADTGTLLWAGVDRSGFALARGVYFAALREGSRVRVVRKFALTTQP